MVFSRYRRKQIAELRPYEPGESLFGVSVSGIDRAAGSPTVGDMIARNPQDHADQWLVSRTYFHENFEPVGAFEDVPRLALAGPEVAPAVVVPAVCNVCRRPAVAGEKLGETCGARLAPVTWCHGLLVPASGVGLKII